MQGLLHLSLSRPERREERRRLGDFFHPPPLRPAKAAPQLSDETLAALVELGLARGRGRRDRPPRSHFRIAAGTVGSCRSSPRGERHAQPFRPHGRLVPRAAGWGVPVGYGAIKSALLAVRDKPGWDLQIDSDERLDMVVAWAKYLGLLRTTREAKGEGLIPDPTPFLAPAGRVAARPRSGAGAPISVATRPTLPVLDGGSIRENVLQTFGIAWPDNRLPRRWRLPCGDCGRRNWWSSTTSTMPGRKISCFWARMNASRQFGGCPEGRARETRAAVSELRLLGACVPACGESPIPSRCWTCCRRCSWPRIRPVPLRGPASGAAVAETEVTSSLTSSTRTATTIVWTWPLAIPVLVNRISFVGCILRSVPERRTWWQVARRVDSAFQCEFT